MSNTTANLSQLLMSYYDRMLLDRLEKNLFFHQFATKKAIPKNSGKTITFARYTNFGANTAPLTENVVSSAIVLSAANVTANTDGYGDYVKISDFLAMTAIDPVIEGALEVLAYRGALSIDTLIRNTNDAGGTVVFANSKVASTIANTDVFNAAEVRKAARQLRAADVAPITGGDYMCILHPNNLYDLQSDTAVGSWLDVHKYTQPKNIFNGEAGKIYGMRFVESTNIAFITTGGAGTANVYNINIFGWNAFAAVSVGGSNLRTYVKRGQDSGIADPLEQINTVGYKFYMGQVVLDANRLLIWKSGSGF